MKSIVKSIIMFILFACAALNVHADILNDLDSVDVNIYLDELDNSKVYSYDIFWGKMDFTYTKTEGYTWNNSTHEYDKYIYFNWVESDNYVEVENHSYFDIDVFLKYESYNENVSGNFNINSFTLKKDEKYKSFLKLDGYLNSSYSEYTKIGNVIMEIK